MKFNSSILKESILEECSYEEEGIEFVESSGWRDDGKYSHNEYIFKFQDKYYLVLNSKTGSYYSEYYYNSEDWSEEIECPEVEKKEKITHEWVVVK